MTVPDWEKGVHKVVRKKGELGQKAPFLILYNELDFIVNIFISIFLKIFQEQPCTHCIIQITSCKFFNVYIISLDDLSLPKTTSLFIKTLSAYFYSTKQDPAYKTFFWKIPLRITIFGRYVCFVVKNSIKFIKDLRHFWLWAEWLHWQSI